MGWKDDEVAEKPSGKPDDFVRTYAPIAQRIGKELQVDPAIILAQFGVETGWGKSVVPGTYNLGNIKDFSGSGVKAKDNQTKTVDAYLKFEDPDTFADYYVDFIKRMYPKAVGAGSDVKAFTTGLEKGVRGSYAEDKNYHPTLASATQLVSKTVGNLDENPFGSGETEAQRIAREPDAGKPAPIEKVTDGEDYAMIGAGVGAAKGFVERLLPEVKLPSEARLLSAQEKLSVAQDRLFEAQKNLQSGSGASLQDLENEYRASQSRVQALTEELKAAEIEAKSLAKQPPASSTSSALGAADEVGGASRKVAGSSGAANWVRAMGQDVPDVIAETAENMRKDNPKGGQAIIDRDVAAKQKIQGLGAGDYKLTGQGSGQLMLPPDVAAEKTVKLETELAERQAVNAAEQNRLTQEAEQKRIAAENKAKQLRQARQTAGAQAKDVGQRVRQAQSGANQVTQKQGAVNVAEKAVERAAKEQPGGLTRFGKTVARSPVLANVAAGAGTGLSVNEAIERYKKGDYSGTVIATIEAALGTMSMTPPVGPVGVAAKGIGTAGGLAMIPVWLAHDYLLKRGAWEEKEE
jgi:hypothetical protein